MVPTQAEVLQVLRDVFTESVPHRPLPADDAPLFGEGGALDSMDLVTFVADVEEEINDRYEASIVVADSRALSRSRSPFRALSALAEYCIELMGGEAA
jgi:acyl carrier protein